MRKVVQSFTDVVLSAPSVVLTIVALGYAIGLAATGALVDFCSPMMGFLSSSQLIMLAAAAFLIVSCLHVRRSRALSWQIRLDSASQWLTFELRSAIDDMTLLLMPIVAASLALSGTGVVGSWQGCAPELIVTTGLSLLMLAAFFVAVRGALVAVMLFSRSWVVMTATAIFAWVLGATLSAGRPVELPFDLLNWMTWVKPQLASEATGHSFLGIVLFPVSILLLFTALRWRDRAYGGSRGMGWVMSASWIAVAAIAVQYLYMLSFVQIGERIDIASAYLIVFQGPASDQVGIPVLSMYFTVFFFLGPPFLMIRQWEEERGGWALLVLIRSGTPLRWSGQFLRRWLGIATGVLLAAPATTLIAWIILPDTARLGSISSDEFVPLAIRYLVIGFMQVAFYLLLTFTLAQLSGNAVVGTAALFVMLVAAILNPLTGGWVPAYFNALSRSTMGWEGVLRDSAVLVLCLTLLAAVIIFGARMRVRPLKERSMSWLR